MHDLLEAYLAEVSEALRPLPVARRNDELREMRQHLLNAVMVNKESGQSEEEAALTAVDQFGVPQKLGENVVWAWRRGRSLDRRSFWGAAICIVMMTLVLSFGWRLWLFLMINTKQVIPGDFPIWLETALVVGNFATPLIVGGTSGYLFPRRALRGTAFAAIICSLVGLAQTSYIFVQLLHYRVVFPVVFPQGLTHITWLCIAVFTDVVKIPLTILAAWGGSRRRTRKAAIL